MNTPQMLGINMKHMDKVYDRLKVDMKIHRALVARFDKIKQTVFDSSYVDGVEQVIRVSVAD